VSPAARGSSPRPSPSPASPAPVWLLTGPEEGEKAAFLQQLAAGLEKSHGEPPEVHRFYAFEAQVPEVVRCLRNQSLFARHRLVILGEAHRVKSDDEIAALAEYVKNPAPDATLVLESSENPSEMNRKIAGDTRRKAAGIVPLDRQKVFWEMFDNQKPGWVVNFFRQRRIDVHSDAVESLLDMVENNTRDMRVECERLALFFGPGASIDRESVERYISHSKEENVFTLFAAVAARDLGQSAEILEKILLSRETEPTQLASGLLWQFRNLARLKRLLADNYEMTEACARLRITSRKNQKTYADAARAFSAVDAESVILCLAGFDERLRSFRSDLHPLLLRLMLYYIVQRAGQGAWRQ
jgi:DNA polymerase III subunit delta